MKTTTKFAIAAVASALMGTSALAADLGGSCCADLEERIAELEATTVRKGNRKVSVQLSGYVSHHVMWWDDGTQSDTYYGDAGNYGSRWRMKGSAKITPDVSAGFLAEFQITNNGLGGMNQLNGGDDLGGNENGIRDTTVWLRHSKLGMVKMGQGSTATDNLNLIDLGGTSGASTPDIELYNGGFILRANNGLFANTGTTWSDIIRANESFDTTRRNHVLYETPSLAGFTVQAAVAEDNFWDVALRYAGEFNGIRVAFGIGWREDSEYNSPSQAVTADNMSVSCTTRCDVTASSLTGSASVLHVPTGLFLTTAWGFREVDGQQTAGNAATAYAGPDIERWYVAGGIRKNHFGIGDTVLFGEYTHSKGALEQAAFFGGASDYNPNLVGGTRSSSEMEAWGIGVVQYIDAAAMEIYATYRNYSAEADGFTGASAALNKGASGISDFSTVIIGSRVSF